ncbi:hypothetical protein E5676_scaffold255G008660 [Cucumis melo var. makuwa]|uniref:Uncharacterized protein n=1 Tax=Cucumis melo var. makuwa TaxID=1194695 RepID=A0A5A7UDN3_CUCMM|nr:hypothetical protein E6C27_scaffold120G001820 [Cucumis melo var. makuwa]TYK13248.1 hypothetical protein E5676_scaffold255G008660 [Cucumis melo var. makuwa]
MTVTEREEEGNSSNTNIVEIKKEPVEFDQEEQDGIDALLNLALKDGCFSDDQLQIDNEEEDTEESERSTKRTRTAESDEAESLAIKNTGNLEANQPELGMDPLEVMEEIVLKYHDFINEIYQMLKDDQKDDQKDEHKKVKIQWQKWRGILDRGNLLVEVLNRSLKTVEIEMEWMKSIEGLHREYSIRRTHVPDLLALLRDINERIELSPHFKAVSDMTKRDEVLPMCLDELETSKEELTEMVEVIQELKVLDLDKDEAVEDGEREEIGIDEIEKVNAEFDEVLKEIGIELDMEQNG